MSYIIINLPPFPFFVTAGNALYRPGDSHPNRPRGIIYFDLILVESGALYMEIDDKLYTVRKNCALIIPPNCSHQSYRVCTEKTFFHWLHLCTNEPTEIVDSPKVSKGFSSAPLSPYKKEFICMPVFQTLDNQRVADVISIMSQLEVLFINKFEHSTHSAGVKNDLLCQQELTMRLLSLLIVATENVRVNAIAFSVLQNMKTHYAEEISLTELASSVNCHPTHVIRCFKKQYGITPNQALTNIRLQRSCQYLQSETLSIADIGYNVGFSSPSYFCKVFKKKYGISPLQYRDSQVQQEPPR